MTYMPSAQLQAAIYQHLMRDPAVAELISGEIFDAPPPRSTAVQASDHITLGEETVRPYDTKTSRGAVHEFLVTVHSQQDGFDTAKKVAAAVCESLVQAPLVLEEGTLVDLRFVQARAERARAPEKRRVSLRFRAIVDQDS